MNVRPPQRSNHVTMKTLSFLAALLFTVPATSSFAATLGFSGTLEVQSVSASEQKIVLVVSGPGELLLSKPSDASGNAQTVTSTLDHATLVLYRRGTDFPTDQAWQQACEEYKHLAGQKARFETATPQYVWEGTDLTLVSTQQLRMLPSPRHN